MPAARKRRTPPGAKAARKQIRERLGAPGKLVKSAKKVARALVGKVVDKFAGKVVGKVAGELGKAAGKGGNKAVASATSRKTPTKAGSKGKNKTGGKSALKAVGRAVVKAGASNVRPKPEKSTTRAARKDQPSRRTTTANLEGGVAVPASRQRIQTITTAGLRADASTGWLDASSTGEALNAAALGSEKAFPVADDAVGRTPAIRPAARLTEKGMNSLESPPMTPMARGGTRIAPATGIEGAETVSVASEGDRDSAGRPPLPVPIASFTI